MSEHSVAEAKTHLSKLIDRAIAGETVVITRHGHAVVEIRPAIVRGNRMTKAAVEKLFSQIAVPLKPVNAVETLRRIRDEGP